MVYRNAFKKTVHTQLWFTGSQEIDMSIHCTEKVNGKHYSFWYKRHCQAILVKNIDKNGKLLSFYMLGNQTWNLHFTHHTGCTWYYRVIAKTSIIILIYYRVIAKTSIILIYYRVIAKTYIIILIYYRVIANTYIIMLIYYRVIANTYIIMLIYYRDIAKGSRMCWMYITR